MTKLKALNWKDWRDCLLTGTLCLGIICVTLVSMQGLTALTKFLSIIYLSAGCFYVGTRYGKGGDALR